MGSKWNKRVGVKRDANERPIVRKLEQIGASVLRINDFDLLVGWRNANFVIECKIPGEDIRKGVQAERWEDWRGQKAVAHSFEEACAVIGAKVAA